MVGATRSSRRGWPGSVNTSYWPSTLPESQASAAPTCAADACRLTPWNGEPDAASAKRSLATRKPVTFDAIQADRSTTIATSSSGARNPVTAETGSTASLARARSCSTTRTVSARANWGPRGAHFAPNREASCQSTNSVIVDTHTSPAPLRSDRRPPELPESMEPGWR